MGQTFFRVTLALLGAALLVESAPPLAAQQPTDVILHNGKVLTVDSKFSTAEAVAVRDGDYSDLTGSAVVMITAGVNEKAGGATDRSDPVALRCTSVRSVATQALPLAAEEMARHLVSQLSEGW